MTTIPMFGQKHFFRMIVHTMSMRKSRNRKACDRLLECELLSDAKSMRYWLNARELFVHFVRWSVRLCALEKIHYILRAIIIPSSKTLIVHNRGTGGTGKVSLNTA